MKKLEAYKQVCVDVTTAMEIKSELELKLSLIKDIQVANSLTVSVSSTNTQFIYAVGILNSQLSACNELELDSAPIVEKKLAILEMKSLLNDFNMWTKYTMDLKNYKHEVGLLLSDDDKFKLLDYPTNPQV